MTQTRIYLPLSPADVAALVGSGEVSPSSAFAVTPALRSDLPTADEEEREYAAMGDAAASAAEAWGGAGGGKRVVAAADVDAAAVLVSPARPGEARSLVRVQGPVPLRRIVSLHIDEKPGGDGDLLWYDVTELAEVARQLR
ncbi:MAG: hypothetical protein ABI131_06405 [Nostocoides sp.]